MKDFTPDTLWKLMEDKYTGEVCAYFQDIKFHMCYLINGAIVNKKEYFDYKFNNKLENIIDA